MMTRTDDSFVALADRVRFARSRNAQLFISIHCDALARGDGEDVCAAIEALCTVTRDGYAARAGDPFVLRPWQKMLIGRVFARRPDGRNPERYFRA